MSRSSSKKSRRLRGEDPEMFHLALTDSGDNADDNGVPTNNSTTNAASTTAQDKIPSTGPITDTDKGKTTVRDSSAGLADGDGQQQHKQQQRNVHWDKDPQSDDSHLSRERQRLTNDYETLQKLLELDMEEVRLAFEHRQSELNMKRKLLRQEHEMKDAAIKEAHDHKTPLNPDIEQTLKYFKPSVNRKRSIADYDSQPSDSDDEPVVSKSRPSKTTALLEKMLARQSTPKELPIFNGEPSEWPLFIRQFENSTKMCGLSNEENAMRLAKCLKGKAYDTVHSMLGISDNVPMVIETLQMTFGRPDQIIKTMIAKAKCLPAVTEDKPDSLLNLSNSVRGLVATMRTLQCTAYLMNPTLLEELLEKLPFSLKLQWCLKSDDMTPSLYDFSDWLTKMAKATCKFPTPLPKADPGPSDRAKDFRGHRESNYKKHQPLPIRLESRFPNCCKFCKQPSHKLTSCFDFQKSDVERRWKFVSEHKLCFLCLSSGHHTKQCQYKKECGKDGCRRFHHPLLHKPFSEAATTSTVFKPPNANAPPSSFLGHHATCPSVLLKIIPIKLEGPRGSIETFAFLDDGSTTSVIDAKFADSIGLDGKICPLTMKWTNDVIHHEPNSKKVTVKLSGILKSKKKFDVNLRTVTKIKLRKQTLDIDAMRAKWPHLIDVPFPSLMNAEPMIMIGQDNLNLMLTQKTVKGDGNAPVGTKTPLGWVVHGPTNTITDNEHVMIHTCDDDADDDEKLDKLVADSFSLEMFGVANTNSVTAEEEVEDRAMMLLRTTTKRIGERFETGLLWKEDNFRYPDSYRDAFIRLRYMEKKMDQDPKFADAYCDKIRDYEVKEYARKMTSDEAAITKPTTLYIPHFAVFNPNKPGKMRFVFDAAAKSGGVSLNDAFLKGPDLLPHIPAVLWRFRRGKIGYSGDVKEMFHQVRIRQTDQDALRFLWRGMRRDGPPDVYVMQAMIFGAACSPASAIYVRDKNAEEFRNEFPDAVDAITKNTYMDDTIDSCDSVEEADKRIRAIIEIYRRGGFVCCNWFSSSRDVMRKIPVDLRAAKWKDAEMPLLPTERVLGMYWNTEKDSFTYRTAFRDVDESIVTGQQLPTKRQVLKMLMSIFDPLGLITHLIIKGRIIFQDVWKTAVGWDEIIPDSSKKAWLNWIDEIKLTTTISIPRCYSKFLPHSKIQLHVFNDASQEAFACAAYLRFEHDGLVEVSLINGKARVKPIKEVTIPRMELQAALMGSRLANSIQKEIQLNIESTFLWSDSQAVICWIKNNHKLPRWEMTRVNEITQSTEPKQWRWVPTDSNPADLATRRDKKTDFDLNSMWYAGPEFLRKTEDTWPVLKLSAIVSAATEAEMIMLTSTEDDDDEDNEFYALPDPNRFDCWLKLIRTTAWLLRFIYNCKNSIKREGELTVEELDRAEILWVKQTQIIEFKIERRILLQNRTTTNKETIPKSSKLYKLEIFIDDDDIMRLKSRTELSATIQDDAKFPLLLCSHSRYVTLLLLFHHRRLAHKGTDSVIYRVQQKYWILGVRNAVKKVVISCQFCSNRRAVPCDPTMGLLPPERVNQMTRPFSCIGLDYFGPMYVTVGRKIEKRYGLIFVCMSVRCVHVEMTERLTTDSTLNAIRRFLSRRGYPSDIFSDNGQSFRGCQRELRELLKKIDNYEIQRSMTAFGINWRFSPPATPHWGGSYERLIRSVKTALNATLRERIPKPETLQTLICEAEFIVNSRPLTHVSVNPNDPEALTPMHFLLSGDRRVPSWSDPNPDLRKQYQVAQQLTDKLWSRWVKEYLPTLNLKPKWNTPSRNVKVDDVVLVADPNGPRNSWPIGVVERVFPGPDGAVRVAIVKTKERFLRRNVRSLVILDVRKHQNP